MKILGILILVEFYAVYIGKMIYQKQRGIQTDQMAKGKRDRVFYVEFILKIATYLVVLVEVLSIFLSQPKIPVALRIVGFILACVGDGIFTVSVVTMKDSWRAGIAVNDQTKMVTDGIYSISRNPAFLGFDCVYLGLLLMFFNGWLAIASGFAIVMLHLQILQEEAFLPTLFGDAYLQYRQHVHRYIGRS